MKSEVEIAENGNIRIHIPAVLRCHGGQKRIVTREGRYANGSDLAKALGVDPSLVSRTMRLTRLSPAMVHRIVTGDYPESLSCTSLRETIPLDWREQEALLQSKG